MATFSQRQGSIALARSLCVEIKGYADDEQNDTDGLLYGSIDIAEILSGEILRLREFIASEQIKFPVLDNILSEYLEKGAYIAKKDGEWHLFRKDGEGIAHGEKISDMLQNLIFTDGITAEK